MNISLNDINAVDFNNSDIAKVMFNNTLVWEKPAGTHIYGVEWNGSTATTSVLTRTDSSANFSDPDPYVNDGSHPGSSPFDNLYPWNGMVRQTINSEEVVVIPKFWYKMSKTDGVFKLQIADYAADGFSVDPIHAEAGGTDVNVYVSRYQVTSSYKSITNSLPLTNITRVGARITIGQKGAGYRLYDYKMMMTIQMLYLVEFANWNIQSVIGYGGNDSGGTTTYVSGQTDSMPYHTGIMQSSKQTYGPYVQYRWIENLWANVDEWCDGISASGSSIRAYINPSQYNDSPTGTGSTAAITAATSTNYIEDFGVSVSFPWIMWPTSTGHNDLKVGDYYDTSGTNMPCLIVSGGSNNNQQYTGLFRYGWSTTTIRARYLGCRYVYVEAS